MLKSDRWINEQAAAGMIEPFQGTLVRHLEPESAGSPVLSFGCSSYGYDLRLSAKEFLIFRHVPGMVMNPKLKLMVDTEIYLFRAAVACEIEIEWQPDVWQYFCRHGEAKGLFQGMIADLMAAAPDHRPVLAFSTGYSFRYGIWPSYKANRKKYRKPCGYQALVDWVSSIAAARDWGLAALPDVEADDVLGILAGPGDVIASVDKDMLTIPGLHLRDRGELLEVSRLQADLAFYAQTLTGDQSDNYPGCPKVGEVGARRLLEGLQTEQEMWAAVLSAFRKAGLDDRYALAQARCARILRPEDYDLAAQVVRPWVPPVG